MGKKGLDVVSCVCQGHGRKKVKMHVSFLLSLQQHELLSLASQHAVCVVFKKIFIQLTYFPTGYVVPFFP